MYMVVIMFVTNAVKTFLIECVAIKIMDLQSSRRAATQINSTTVCHSEYFKVIYKTKIVLFHGLFHLWSNMQLR